MILSPEDPEKTHMSTRPGWCMVVMRSHDFKCVDLTLYSVRVCVCLCAVDVCVCVLLVVLFGIECCSNT